ncbi:hypothetical protein JHK84_056044 [Glycine max]|nr:hypothetical protein JHK86_055992 [Glycine max]KAG4918740.1 hypothetical protein JHK85_057021 [Glycine max]KAG5074813.1 hypothetical protein JHK84_056044 [Glycine max]
MRGSTASFAHSFNRKHNRTLFHLYSTMPRNLLPKMPRKRSPIFLKVSLLIHKLRKPIIPKLFPFLKKLRKREELKLLRHYDYGEYQFSASSTPLIHRNQFKNRGHRDLCSLVCVLVHGKLQNGFIEAEDLYDSVDEKAERFIETFYQQMRMQSQNPYISSSHSSLCRTA